MQNNRRIVRTPFFCYLTVMFKSLLIFLVPFSVAASSKPPQDLLDIESKYQKASSVVMDVEKKLTLSLLGKTKTSKGTIKMSRGKLRWDTTEPDKTMVLMSKNVIWVVDYPSDEDEKGVVLKIKNPSKNQPHAVVAFLMGKGSVTTGFKVVSQKKQKDGTVKIQLEATDKNAELPAITMVIDNNKKIISSIKYEDSVQNETVLTFKNISFEKKLAQKTFKFKKPKGFSLTELK